MPVEQPKYRAEKTASLVKGLVAEFLVRESRGPGLITVTDIQVAGDRKTGLVFLTVFPEKYEAGVLDFAQRKRREITDYVKEKARMRVIPHLSFVIDLGEKNRQRIDEILHKEQQEGR